MRRLGLDKEGERMELRDIALCIAVVVVFSLDIWLFIHDFRKEYKRQEEIRKRNDEIIKKYKGEQAK